MFSRAAASDFDVMLTMDAGVQDQQNVAALPLAVIVIHAPSNDMEDLRPLVPRVVEALATIKPRTVVEVR